MGWNTNVPAHDLDELWVALACPDRGHVANEPEKKTRDPQAQTKTKGCGYRAVQNGNRPRRPTHQDWFSQGAMNGRNKACDLLLHQITTPPPNEKNDRKKLDAAKAIDRPNTIWTKRRKPPEVSPNASDRPVVIITMTPMIFATGPSIDCRSD